MKEIWKEIPSFEGYYMVSNFGNVKSMERKVAMNKKGDLALKKEKILSQAVCNKRGYCRVQLHKMNKSKMRLVHRLVAITFIPNPHKKSEVNHINGIKNDNRVENLEWCTPKENMFHAQKMNLIKNILKGEKTASNKLKEYQVLEIRNRVKNEKVSYKSIGLEYQVSGNTIRSICLGLKWKYLLK